MKKNKIQKFHIGLIGYGTVGQGVVKILKNQHRQFLDKYGIDFSIQSVCDRSLNKKNTKLLRPEALTNNIDQTIHNPDLDVIIELIGGLHPARKIVTDALNSGKNVVTANKALISYEGKKLFQIARKNKKLIGFESAVGAGVPMIKTITESMAGNSFENLYGIINGTCNFILDQMTETGSSFEDALKEAQRKGYAESDPTLDINGMDSAHKLSILVSLAMGKTIPVKNIYTEGITHISHKDIENAENLGLCIKLLAIAKKHENAIEVRVHPTLILKDHPLASINSIHNALFLQAEPLGNILLSGEGAGQMAAASGVVSDLINIATSDQNATFLSNLNYQEKGLKLQKIDDIETKFYLRFMAADKPGTLSQIAGILGRQNISINSITQDMHLKKRTVPVVMLTENTTERALRHALNRIHKKGIVSSKPVAIRMEKLW